MFNRTAILLGIALEMSFPQFSSAGDLPKTQLNEFVRRAVQNEIKGDTGPGAHFMFKDHKQTAHLWQTKLVVETRDATAGLVIEQNGKPLTPQEQRAEQSRLEAYVHNPEELNKKRKQEKEDADHTERILRALPDAFIYETAGTQPGTDRIGKPGDELVKLNFHPNPNYVPPSHVEQVLTGMSGHLLIDAKENHIAEIDGTLQKEVGFGWGILGHLDRGGRFLVQQADVGSNQWEPTRMELSFTGKILLFKKLSIHSVEVFSGFQRVPENLTFAQGVELLEKQSANGASKTGSSDQNARESKPQITALKLAMART